MPLQGARVLKRSSRLNLWMGVMSSCEVDVCLLSEEISSLVQVRLFAQFADQERRTPPTIRDASANAGQNCPDESHEIKGSMPYTAIDGYVAVSIICWLLT